MRLCFSHVTTGCSTLKLLVESFGDVISQHCQLQTAGAGVDITREERVTKCRQAMQLALKCQQALQRLSSAVPAGRVALQIRSCLTELEMRLLNTGP